MNEDYKELLDGVDLFSEAYYGKIPEFIVLEKLFDKVIEKVNAEGLRKANPNKYKEMRQIEDIFKSVFGFKKATIYWEPFITPNAYTYSFNVLLIYSDKKKYIEKTDKGFYDNSKSTTLAVFGYMGLFELGLSSRELTAIILHEIGHNFDMSPYHKIDCILNNIFSLGAYGRDLKKKKNKIDELRDDVIEDISTDGDKIYNNQKRRDKLSKNYEEAEKNSRKLSTILEIFTFPINSFNNFAAFLMMPLTNIFLISGKKGELFADSFATAYGYGTELISGLDKLDNSGTKYYNPKSRIMRFLTDLQTMQFEVLIALTDVHGTTHERCQECIEKLRWDLSHNDFPPELKQELINEINKMTSQYKQLSTFDEHERLKLTKISRKLISTIFNGKPNLIKFLKRHKV